MSKLRSRNGVAPDRPTSKDEDNDGTDSERSVAAMTTPPWLTIPTVATLGCLLLLTLWGLHSERKQVTAAHHVIKELKTHVRLMKEELNTARRIAMKGDGLAALDVKALQADKAKLQSESTEAKRKLQEMINRMSLLQSEKGKLLAQVQALVRDKRQCQKRLGLLDGAGGGAGAGASGEVLGSHQLLPSAGAGGGEGSVLSKAVRDMSSTVGGGAAAA